MEIKLPEEKNKKIRMETMKLKHLDNPQAIALSRPLGKLNHATQAIQPAPLFYCNLQSCLQEALEEDDQDSATPVRLTLECIEEKPSQVADAQVGELHARESGQGDLGQRPRVICT